MIADRDWGLTADGTVVEQTDARCVRVLVGRGCFMPDDVARRHGLLGDDEGAVPAAERAAMERPADPAEAEPGGIATQGAASGKSLTAPRHTKHLRAPRETKQTR